MRDNELDMAAKYNELERMGNSGKLSAGDSGYLIVENSGEMWRWSGAT